MFCHKCGHKSIDGAAFCQKCGAKMIKDQSEAQISAEPVIVSPETATPLTELRNISTAEPVQQASAAPVPTGIQEAYGSLNESAKRCPKIKKIAVSKGAMGTTVSSVLIHGFFNKYTYTPGTNVEKSSISWVLKLALYIVYAPILLCDALFLTFFFQEEYYLALTICSLIGCVVWFPFLFFVYKEKKEIVAHVNETLGCEIKVPSKVSLVISYVLNLIQIGLCIAALVFGFSGSGDTTSAVYNDPASSLVDSVSLSQTYTNEGEGFSFSYPDTWTIKEDSMMVAVLAPAESGYSANIGIMKGDVDESYFSATMSDFEMWYSGKDNLRIIDLYDVTLNGYSARKLVYSYNDNKGSYTQVQYFYCISSDMYMVTCTSLENYFDKYAPVFEAIMDSYTIIAANTSGESGTASATYFVDQSSETYQPTLILYPDGKFTLLANLYTGVGIIHGTYNQDDTGHTFDVETRSFSGAIGDNVKNFYMEADGDSLIYASTQQIGTTAEGSRFSMSNDIPETMKEFANSSGAEKQNDIPATVTATDFIGTYSYDASFEDPTGKWNNFYYLLEIGLDGSALVVTQTWRGNYLFDHARVSPSDVTGNTLVFDTSAVGSTEPEIHSLTYTPAKDSPLGTDTIYIDDDDTMPFVRE